jgi:hypothetical protein
VPRISLALTALALALIGPAALAPAQTFSNPEPIVVPGFGPASPYPSTILVSGLSGRIVSVTVALYGLEHGFPDDMDVLLVGPQGQTVVLMSDCGGAANLMGVDLVFADGAPPLPDSGLITSGTYSPTNIGAGDAFPPRRPPGRTATPSLSSSERTPTVCGASTR